MPQLTSEEVRWRKEVAQRLERYDLERNPTLAARYPPHQYPHTRRCAVLIPLFLSPSDGQLHVLLTKRAATLRTHASDVSFPGGAQDPADRDDTHTALREAHEEVGLPPDDVTPVAHLPPFFARTRNSVFPVVAFIPNDFQPEPNPHEVALVFSVPLKKFLSDEVRSHHVKMMELPYVTLSMTFVVDGSEVTSWGVTCMMCVLVAHAIFGPYKRVRLLSIGDRRKGGSSGDEEVKAGDVDDDDDDNVFGDLAVFYHEFCRRCRPVSQL